MFGLTKNQMIFAGVLLVAWMIDRKYGKDETGQGTGADTNTQEQALSKSVLGM